MQTLVFVLLGNSFLSGTVYGCAVKFCSALSSKKRIVLLSALSGAFNAILYLLPMSGAFKLPVKLFLFALGALLCVQTLQFKRAFYYLCVSLFVYFSFEGITLFFGVDDLVKFFIALCPFVLFGVLAVSTLSKRYKIGQRTVKCKVFAVDSEECAECLALVDTGDLVSFKGKGVIIASEKFLAPYIDEAVGKVEINTPCGKEQADVFSLPVEIYLNDKKNIVKYAYFAPLKGLNGNDYSLVMPSEYCKEAGEC